MSFSMFQELYNISNISPAHRAILAGVLVRKTVVLMSCPFGCILTLRGLAVLRKNKQGRADCNFLFSIFMSFLGKEPREQKTSHFAEKIH